VCVGSQPRRQRNTRVKRQARRCCLRPCSNMPTRAPSSTHTTHTHLDGANLAPPCDHLGALEE
jgi:hypothetical protein